MKVFRKMMILGGFIVISGVAVTMALHQYYAEGGIGDLEDAHIIAAEPTPGEGGVSVESEGANDSVGQVPEGDEVLAPISTDKMFTTESGKSREQVIDEVLAQFNWEDEESKEAFRQKLMESGLNGFVIHNGFGAERDGEE